MAYLIQQSAFIFKKKYWGLPGQCLRRQWFSFLGMSIGKGTRLPKIIITWPHQVKIGRDCMFEQGIYFKYDGIWKKEPSIIIGDEVFIGAQCEFNISGGITIGNKTMIASGCKFIDHNHGMSISEPMNNQVQHSDPIAIGEEAWLGANVIVLKGVQIGKGAVVAAGSVLRSNVGDYEIFGGVPAKLIKKRT